MRSSYLKNALGLTLMAEVIRLRPMKIVEFGVLDGYSTLWLGMGLRYNKLGHLIAYDLWDKYPHKRGKRDEVDKQLHTYGLQNLVGLDECDFFEWLKSPEDFDLLHLDISNDGDIIEQAIEALEPRIEAGAVLLFEGGSEERDKEPWMIKHKHRPIRDVLKRYKFEVIDDRWPSLSIMDKECLEKSKKSD